MRINARLDGEWEEKIQYISQACELNQTDIVKQAIDLLYQKVRAEHLASYPLLLQSGFVGGGEGPKDLSQNYKQYFNKDLTDKYDHY